MSDTSTEAAPLTVVLVHGAFADSSSWNGVDRAPAGRRGQGHRTPEPAARHRTRLRLRRVLHQADPRAGPRRRPLLRRRGDLERRRPNAENVVGLVFVAAFAPDEGERLGEVTPTSKDAVLGTALVPLQYPTGNGEETAVEFAIDPAKLHDVFAADLAAEQAAVLAATQRPVAELGFSEPSGTPAWKSLPSWTVLASRDLAAGTDLVRSMAERAGATITEVEGSHVIMISRPDVVADVIMTAAAAAGREAAATAH